MKTNIIRFSIFKLVFLVITTAVYSQQKKDCSGKYAYFSFYMSYNPNTSENKIFYTDSTIINGVTVYTDSLVVEITVSYSDSTVIGDSVIYSGRSTSYKVDYPFTLTNNPPFKKAIYRDYCELMVLMRNLASQLLTQSIKKIKFPDEKKAYYILSPEGRYINYASLTKADGELYAKYKLNKKDKNIISIRNYGKLRNFVQQEMEKGHKVIIDSKNSRTYIVKSVEYGKEF